MSRFLHKKFKSLIPYDTSEEIESMKGYVRLNTNESPFEPSPKARSYAFQASQGLNYYSDPECSLLAEKISSMFGVKKSEIVFGNGSDEILNFIFAAFCENGAAFPEITYSFYKILADYYGVDYVTVPLRNFRISPDDYCEHDTLDAENVRTSQSGSPEKNLQVSPNNHFELTGRTIFIANPNAPTGIALTLRELEKIITSNRDSLIVIDEAYVDFGAESAVKFIRKYDNVIVVRTFSKSRSLAGARLGWCMTSENIARDMRTIKNTLTPYNINAMTQAAALGALEDEEYTQKNIALIRMTRDNTKTRLREMGFEVLDSSTNFLFARHKTISGEKIFNGLKKYKIIVRRFSNPPELADFNRITIGTTEQMQIMLEIMKGIVKNETK